MGPIIAIKTAWRHWNQHRRFMLTRTAILIGTIVLAMLCLGGGLTFSKATPLFMVLYFGFIMAATVYQVWLNIVTMRLILNDYDVPLSDHVPFWPFIGNYIVVIMLAMLVYIPMLLVASLSFVLGEYAAFAAVPLFVIVILVLYYCIFRWGFCLPGVAAGIDPYGPLEGWRDSKDYVWPLIGALLLLGIGIGVVVGLLALPMLISPFFAVLPGLAYLAALIVSLLYAPTLFATFWGDMFSKNRERFV